MNQWLTTTADYFNAHPDLFSGLGATILLGIVAWTIRIRRAIPAYLPFPWVPLRYLNALRKDQQLRQWRRGSAILHAIETSAVYVNRSRVPLLSFLKRSAAAKNRVLVLGEPGCGKSATFEALTADLATRGLKRAIAISFIGLAGATLLSVFLSSPAPVLVSLFFFRFVHRMPIPIYVEMRKRTEISLEAQLIQTLRKCDGGNWLIDRLHRLAAARQIVLIFDGVNEFMQKGDDGFERAWSDFVAPGSRFGKCAALISSRELSTGAGGLPGVARVAVCDLDDDGVRYCLGFYESNDVVRDFETLKSRHMLRDFGIGRNPYWLRMMIESDLYTPNRGALFENFARILLGKEKKPGDPPIDEQLACLARLARMMADKGAVGDELSVVEQMAAPGKREIELILTRAEAAKLVRRSLREQRIEFSHHLVQEFFTAYSLINDRPAVLEHLDDYTWWGAFVMLGGLIDEHLIDGSTRVGDRARFRELVISLCERAESGRSCLLAIGLLWTIEKPEMELQMEVARRLLPAMGADSLDTTAIVALMKVADDAVLAGFLRFLESNGEVAAKNHLLKTLSKVKTSKIASIAVALVADAQLGEAARAALTEIGEAAIRPILEAANAAAGLESRYLELLAPAGMAAVSALIDEVTDDESPFHAVSMRALVNSRESSAERLIDTFRRELSKEARERVKQVLIQQGDRAIPALWGAFLKGDVIIQSSVTDVLEQFGPKVVPVAMESWDRVLKLHYKVIGAVVGLLRKIDDERAASLLESVGAEQLANLHRSSVDSAAPPFAYDRRHVARATTVRVLVEWFGMVVIFALVELMRSRIEFATLVLAAIYASGVEIGILAFDFKRARSRRFLAVVAGHAVGVAVTVVAAGALTGITLVSWQVAVAAFVSISFVIGLRIFGHLGTLIDEYSLKRVLIFGDRPTTLPGGFVHDDGSATSLVVAYVHQRSGVVDLGGKITSLDENSLVSLCQRLRVDQIVVASFDTRRAPNSMPMLAEAQSLGVEVIDLPTFLERENQSISLERFNQASVLYANRFRSLPIDGVLRTMDFVAGVILLVLCLPILLLSIAAIKIADGLHAPIYFRQARVGLNGQTIQLLKLRTMRVDAESDGGASWASRGDARVTRVGRVLRRLSIDWLPQLWNLIRGDLSLVGPRPERPAFLSAMTESIPYYTQRHCIRPGITGWSQVRYPYGASQDDLARRFEYDLYYIKNRSVILYLKILFKTVRVILFASSRNAY